MCATVPVNQCSCWKRGSVQFQVWDDAVTDGCEPDCRMATTLVEVCARAGDTDRALATYDTMAVGVLCP